MDDFNMDLYGCITDFLARIGVSEVEIYNEASVQYELAIQMRATFGDALKVQLERNIGFFRLDSKRFVKKEADIMVFTPDQGEKHCIEIKFPRSGQYPEQEDAPEALRSRRRGIAAKAGLSRAEEAKPIPRKTTT